MTPHITIAGKDVPSPLNVLADYASKFGGTLSKYDFKAPEDPNVLTEDEIWGTRIIHSRVSRSETAALAEASASWGGLWEDIPVDAHIANADPGVTDGLYANMLRLYSAMTEVPGFQMSKASKVLHIKRPHLFPIVDSRLRARYSAAAATAAKDYPAQGHRRMYWAAIRNDVRSNKPALDELRRDLRAGDTPLSRLATLSDIRVLDMLSWSL